MLIDLRERRREREREGEKYQYERSIDRLLLIRALTRDQTHSLGMCPDWESNLWCFGLWDDTNQLSYSSQGKVALLTNNLGNSYAPLQKRKVYNLHHLNTLITSGALYSHLHQGEWSWMSCLFSPRGFISTL